MLLKLYGAHTSPRGPDSLLLWGGDQESAFLTRSDDAKAMGPRTTLRGYAVHVGRKSAGKSPIMKPPQQGEKEKGNLGVDEDSLSQSASQTCLSTAIV